MKPWIVGLACVGVVGVIGFLVAGRSPPARASAARDGRTPPTPSAVTIIHKHIVDREQEESSAPGNAAPERTLPEIQGPSEQQALFEAEQRFDALPQNATVQARNEDVLRRMLHRVAAGKPLPIDGFSCRGDTCRVAFKFESLDQTRAILNQLPSDEDWIRSGFGLDAREKDPANPASNEWVVYFTAN